jgi:hypothetical protein
VSASGQLYLWGRGDWGQLGTGDGRSHWRPRAVSGINVVPPVAANKYLGFSNVPEVGGGAVYKLRMQFDPYSLKGAWFQPLKPVDP